MPSLRCILASVMFLTLAPVLSQAQLEKAHHASRPTASKGAKLPRHVDNSALVLRKNDGRTGTAQELSRIEQQSLHTGSLHTGPARGSRPAASVKPASSPKTNAVKGDRNQAINFTGHSAGGNHAVTNRKSRGGPPRGAGTRPH